MGAEAENHQQKTGSIPNPNPNPNPISEAQFLAWKRRKDADALAKKDAATRKRAEDIAAGQVQMNGQNPDGDGSPQQNRGTVQRKWERFRTNLATLQKEA
ncbi:unnamed protein product [Fraxinus pennsylvanica]|uniref:ZC3H15/TMA46 family C-terminal domain-containing protein n=1 Tax=Fraxinus pennsylvanica TaxID=56036 RepID=A0AAD1ZL60_9LAMI|nr:unnamed protein product [Fraxinus pennsylvanica]